MRAISRKNAGILAMVGLVCTIVIHIFVMLEVIPYQWINGGRSESLSDARVTSAMSIVIGWSVIL